MRQIKIAKQLQLILLFPSFLFSVTASAQYFETDISHLSVPTVGWGLTVDLSTFQVQKNSFGPDGNSRSILAQSPSGLTVSVFIEKAVTDGDFIACRKYYWDKASKSPLPKENLILHEKGNIAYVEFDIKEAQGKQVNYHSTNGYMSYYGYWIDIHISKVAYSADDKILFENIFNSVKIDSPKVRNVSELFIWSAQAFYDREYKKAIPPFESILETEKDKISLDKSIWKVVVDNLGMSYGISGDFNNSIRIYEYGIKLDPEYPNFYYSLACTYAEMSDLDKALQQLELAVSKKANVINGETFPNPREDSSFQKYKKDKRFKDFLKKNGL